MITIYTRPGCAACERTKKFLDIRDVIYDTINCDDIGEMPDLFKDFTALPIVVVEHDGTTETWSGFRYDKLRSLGVTHGGGR